MAIGAGISIQELMGALQKSGLPFGDSSSMGQAAPFARDAVSQQIHGADTQLPQLHQQFKGQLDQIAQMDQKLATTYGNPSSKMYIENPVSRERAISSPHQTLTKAAQNTASQGKSRKKELDSQVDDALSLYSKLVQVQIKEENMAAKQAKEEYRVKAGKAKYITDAKGNKVSVPVYKTKSTGLAGVSGVKLTKEQKLAGFSDAQAANYWSKIKETDFKRLWVQNLLEGGPNSIPEDGFSIDDVKENYEAWKKTNPTKGKSGSFEEKIKALLGE